VRRISSKNNVERKDTMIIAKPVIDNKFWILQQDNKKVGNVEATDTGYEVTLNNTVTEYKTIKMLEKSSSIHFVSFNVPKHNHQSQHSVYGYPAKDQVFNPIWNVKHKLPLYTTDESSKCWVAAGWYQIKKGRHWAVAQDPKLILLERYPYRGPYFTEKEATNG
jgi:hypothetical protein